MHALQHFAISMFRAWGYPSYMRLRKTLQVINSCKQVPWRNSWLTNQMDCIESALSNSLPLRIFCVSCFGHCNRIHCFKIFVGAPAGRERLCPQRRVRNPAKKRPVCINQPLRLSRQQTEVRSQNLQLYCWLWSVAVRSLITCEFLARASSSSVKAVVIMLVPRVWAFSCAPQASGFFLASAACFSDS